MARPSPRSPLAGVQALMARTILRPLTHGEEMQRTWSDGTPAAAVAEGFIKPNDRLSSFERLQIYNQQYWWRLHGALREDFPGLRAVLGERRFDALATAYLDHCGSRSWTLGHLGSRFEEFLRERPELAGPRAALAFDVTRLEWAHIVAFDGAELAALTVAQIGGTPPALLRLGLQPHISLLELAYPADDLLQKIKRRNAVETDSASNAVSSARPRAPRPVTVARASAPVYLAVHRVEYSVYFKRLEAPAWRLLTALQTGRTLEEACTEALATDPTPPEEQAVNLQRWFADWMRFGWFTRSAASHRLAFPHEQPSPATQPA